MPKVSLALKALRSACIPAPPEQSEPATDKHFNILYSFLMEKGKQKNLLTMQEVKFTQIASYTGLDQQVQRVRFYLLNPAFCLGPPANFIRFFAVLLLFYYNTGQRDCQGKIVQISQVLSSKQNRAVEGASPYIYI
jgi:hypothetical protein